MNSTEELSKINENMAISIIRAKPITKYTAIIFINLSIISPNLKLPFFIFSSSFSTFSSASISRPAFFLIITATNWIISEIKTYSKSIENRLDKREVYSFIFSCIFSLFTFFVNSYIFITCSVNGNVIKSTIIVENTKCEKISKGCFFTNILKISNPLFKYSHIEKYLLLILFLKLCKSKSIKSLLSFVIFIFKIAMYLTSIKIIAYFIYF